MHAKTDSDDVSSLLGLSPTSSPLTRAGPAYYVQSPSTPGISPMVSAAHSRQSSTLFPGSAANEGGGPGCAASGFGYHHRYHHDRQHPFDAIEEERLLGGEKDENDKGSYRNGISRKCWCFIWFVGGFHAIFCFISLVLWGASRNQGPIITITSIKYEEFVVQAGVDTYGVATAMATINATVKGVYRNNGKFFGVHVTSSPLLLMYQDLVIASGTMEYFYERKNNRRQIEVQVKGDKVPLYGGGYRLSSNKKAPINPVPLTLRFRVRTRAYVLGRFVKPKFYKAINCSFFMNPNEMNMALSLRRNCTYI